ncbi:MAG TPA: RNA methyltransferase [Steroidobacteraceae bacterium]|nr:RNA methyltransferase [Steroidobacteraceae bacterium]HNS27743.1 RNA methyltransferase [Steroidobacteraceae bacterium]
MRAADIRFVLVGTQHPGNIGAVARAMKNMALERLVLVRPREFPHPEALSRASGADDVLAGARVFGSLAEAIGDCGYVVATTAREREHNHRVIDVRDAAARVVAEAARGPVAVLFGAERAGLSNEEIDAAHALLRIPANPAYTSLNIAMAAQLIAYEIYRARGARVEASRGTVPLATPAEMARLYEHLEQVLAEINFRDRTQSGTNLMQRLRRLFQRAEPDQNEVNILRGILAAVQGKRRVAGSKCPPRAS